jgi:hypothetical protein
MDKAGLSPAAQGAFKQNYEQLVAGVTGLVRRLGAPGRFSLSSCLLFEPKKCSPCCPAWQRGSIAAAHSCLPMLLAADG